MKSPIVVGYVAVITNEEEKNYAIIIPKPKGTAREIRSVVKTFNGRMNRNSNGGITICAENKHCPEQISNLAYSIGEEVGINIDATTIPDYGIVKFK